MKLIIGVQKKKNTIEALEEMLEEDSCKALVGKEKRLQGKFQIGALMLTLYRASFMFGIAPNSSGA